MVDAARTAEILSHIRVLENKLSPENLYWDGERDARSARLEGRQLAKQLKALVKEIGMENI